MPVRKPPTARQRRLGAELRRMREHVGLSLTEAAALHRVDKTAISNTESARFGVSADRVRVWAANYSCPNQAYVDALANMAKERAGSNWWDDFRVSMASFMLDLVELERHAASLRQTEPEPPLPCPPLSSRPRAALPPYRARPRARRDRCPPPGDPRSPRRQPGGGDLHGGGGLMSAPQVRVSRVPSKPECTSRVTG